MLDGKTVMVGACKDLTGPHAVLYCPYQPSGGKDYAANQHAPATISYGACRGIISGAICRIGDYFSIHAFRVFWCLEDQRPGLWVIVQDATQGVKIYGLVEMV
jgi:hypothetical protein